MGDFLNSLFHSEIFVPIIILFVAILVSIFIILKVQDSKKKKKAINDVSLDEVKEDVMKTNNINSVVDSRKDNELKEEVENSIVIDKNNVNDKIVDNDLTDNDIIQNDSVINKEKVDKTYNIPEFDLKKDIPVQVMNDSEISVPETKELTNEVGENFSIKEGVSLDEKNIPSDEHVNLDVGNKELKNDIGESISIPEGKPLTDESEHSVNIPVQEEITNEVGSPAFTTSSNTIEKEDNKDIPDDYYKTDIFDVNDIKKAMNDDTNSDSSDDPFDVSDLFKSTNDNDDKKTENEVIQEANDYISKHMNNN